MPMRSSNCHNANRSPALYLKGRPDAAFRSCRAIRHLQLPFEVQTRLPSLQSEDTNRQRVEHTASGRLPIDFAVRILRAESMQGLPLQSEHRTKGRKLRVATGISRSRRETTLRPHLLWVRRGVESRSDRPVACFKRSAAEVLCGLSSVKVSEMPEKML